MLKIETSDAEAAAQGYRVYGDAIPPTEELHQLYDRLHAKTFAEIEVALTRGYVCMDLATEESAKAGLWMARAAEALDEVKQWRHIAEVRGSNGEYAVCLPYVARAYAWQPQLNAITDSIQQAFMSQGRNAGSADRMPN